MSISGIDGAISSLTSSLSQKAIQKSNLSFAKQVEKGIAAHIKGKYSNENDLFRLKLSTRVEKTTITLRYKNKQSDLSKFSPQWFWGNIKSSARRRGRVHSVEIIKGRRKISKGKFGNGGFMPRYKSGRAKTFGKFGAQMFERTSDKARPLRLIVGLSTLNMVNSAFRDNKVQNILSKGIILDA